MKRRFLFLCRKTCFMIVFAVILSTNIVNAETLNFEQIKQKIFNHNSDLSATNNTIKATQKEIQQAGAIPNPELEIGTENFGENEIEVVLTQPIELGGKRKARIKIAHKELLMAELEQKAKVIELETKITRQCVTILGLQKKIAILDSLSSVMEESLKYIKRRINAGAIIEADVLRSEMEMDELLLEKSKLKRQLKQQTNVLTSLWGNTDNTDLYISCKLNPSITMPSQQEILKKLNEHPEIKVLKLNMETIDAEINLLKAEAFPEMALSLGYLRNNEEKEDIVLAGISISLPLFDRNKKAILSKSYEIMSAGDKCQAFIVERKTEIATILSEIKQINSSLLVLTEKLKPKANKVYALLERYYKNGSIRISEVLEGRKNLLEINQRLIDLNMEKALLAADLAQLSGININIIQ